MNHLTKLLCITCIAVLASCSFTHSDVTKPSLVDIEKSNNALRAQNGNLQQQIQSTDVEIARLRAAAQASYAPVAASVAPAAIPTDKLWVRINFKSGRSSVLPETRRTLTSIAQKFLANPGNMRLAVLGYSDDEPIGGYRRSHRPIHNYKNLNDLSQARADSVAAVMIQAGIPAYKIQATGMGATDFIASNKTKAGRAKNRRVEIHLISN